MQGFREALVNASAELVASKGGRKESAVVKKLKQPKAKTPKKKATDGKGEEVKDGKGGKKDGKAAAGAGAEKDDEEVEEDEDEKRGVASLMIVKTAGEAWKRLQERLKEAPIIQVWTHLDSSAGRRLRSEVISSCPKAIAGDS